MLSLQELVEIAARHFTAMADAMVTACVAKSVDTGEVLNIPERLSMPGPRGERPTEDVDWEGLVTRNSDSRWQHV